MTEYEKIKFRDDCAIAAMQSSLDVRFRGGFQVPESETAKWSYKMAEAMLEEKLKRNEKLS